MKDVRCNRCGGGPLETEHIGVGHWCRCSISAWIEVDRFVLFIWAEVAL